MVAGAGLLEASDGDVLLGADNLPAGEYFYQRAPTPGGLGVSTRSYQDITVDIAGDTIESQEVFKIDIASRAGLQSMLESRDVYFLLDPVSRGLVSFDCVDLHDNMLLSAVRGCVQLKDRVSNLEAFDVSVAKDFKQAATEAIRQGLLKQHSSVKVIDVQELTCADGSTQKVDGVVIAGGCAAILVAEQQLDDSAVPQLWSCLEFIRDKELTGPAAELKGKMLLGYLAGKTVTSDPGAIKALVRNCHLQGYRILLGSGKSLVPDNRRETTTRVDP